MNINPIGHNYSISSYHKTNCKKQSAPSFKADYSDKPVPPAGKAVAAASALALISGAIYHGVNEFGPKDEPQKPGIEYVFNAVPYDDSEDLNMVDTTTFRKKLRKEQELVAARDTTDSIDNDSILVPDTIPHKKEPEIGHFHGHAYEIIPKGDTVVLVPVSTPKPSDIKNGKADTLDMD